MATVAERKRAAIAKARAARAAKDNRRRRVSADRPIEPEVMYTFTQASEWFGIGRIKLRAMERDGMPCGVASGQKWVRGSDLQDAILRTRTVK